LSSISLRHIKKVYPGNVTAVTDFTLDIADKEFVIFVGPSGCGKSTTLRMIAGLEEISEGEIYIGDTLVNDVQPKDRNIAMVFQSYALYRHMTVYKNMSFSLKLRKMPKPLIDQKVREAASILDITHLLGRKPRALSGGECQRVALGRAMVRDPAVFLLDEPLSNLDAKLRTAMRTELIKLHKRLQTTFIYVTHDQTEAMTMGDRIVIMDQGRIQQVDTPQNIYNRPANLFVAGFIGSPQMNLIPAVIKEDREGFFAEISHSRVSLARADISASKLAEYREKPVTLGIRPEHLSVPAQQQTGAFLPGFEVELCEMLGAETLLHLVSPAGKLVMRVPSAFSLAPGTLTDVLLDLSKIHLFDSESGLSLAPAQQPEAVS